MRRNILELYYNYEAINENLSFIGPLIVEKNDELKRKLDNAQQLYDTMKKISDVIKEFQPNDEFDDIQIKEINEKIFASGPDNAIKISEK